ncbi:YitT family protein [Desulfobotulus sp. H1]|uniref:YitT family protein n=1 Tax=Desulfobotulus pelophilus TaxID=2823377 RepID=A0ABT3N5H8_9BACT|nr:YitT family protein [Desulfobotulus pelophilus]MCW7752706.1 YitT family protein [Desulfobotulus pelophilus]
MKRFVVDYGIIFFAGLLYAVALKYFVLPSQVILTGTEGVASALSYYFESYWLFVGLYLTFQALLLSFAFWKVSHTFALRSLLVVATVGSFLALMPDLQVAQPEPQNERMILVIFGGLLAGVAKAMALHKRGSTGDEDVLAAYFAMKYLKSVGYIAVFAAIVSTAFGLFMDFLKYGQLASAINTLMYTCIYIFVSTTTLNNFYRKFQLTMLSVITRRKDAVGAAIKAASSHRTYTVQKGIGGHSGERFWRVQTIITHEELPQFLAAVEGVDPECFYYYENIEGISKGYYISPIG